MELNDEIVRLYVEEGQEHLDGIEDVLLEIESGGANADKDLVNRVFRAIHSIKGGAGFFGLDRIKDLAHVMENVLNMIRNSELIPTPEVVSVLLDAADLLKRMFEDIGNSNALDISAQQQALKAIAEGDAGEDEGEGEDENQGQSQSQSQDDNSGTDDKPAPAQDDEAAARTAALIAEFMEEFPDASQDAETPISADATPSPPRGAATEAPAPAATLNDPAPAAAPKSASSAQALKSSPPATARGAAPGSGTAPGSGAAPGSSTAPGSSAAPSGGTEERRAIAAESKLRVSVRLLDQLMTLAGELVLTRNQMSMAISKEDNAQILQASQRLDLITSELQEAIVSTRMQPVGVVFSKFRRIVRDMARQLGKNIALEIQGEEVELDKTIIEGLSDPLTHLVRNAVDHGIETADERKPTGKPEEATLTLRAFHEAGQVVIEVSDDGRGIDPRRLKAKALENQLRDQRSLDAMSESELLNLIFLPGFSTAKEVSDISGRGVGMDVVNTNLAELGGSVDLKSQVGAGTSIRIKLPLTLAIIPSLIVRVGAMRFAIPQVSVQELVRIKAQDVPDRIQSIGASRIMRMRGELVPVVRLTEVLRIDPVFFDRRSGQYKPDRRQLLQDRRSEPLDEAPNPERRRRGNRRMSFESAVSVIVVMAGSLRYGLVVDQLMDSEEIVVKPLDKHFQERQLYAGATIQGDGGVAMILDVMELSRFVDINPSRVKELERFQRKRGPRNEDAHADRQSLLLVRNAEDDRFAIPLPLITRIEKVERRLIEFSGQRRSMIYRDGSLVLFTLSDVANVAPLAERDELFAVVFSVNQRQFGLLVSAIEDTLNIAVEFDRETFGQPGIFGSAIIRDRTTLLIDLLGIVEAVEPAWARRQQPQEAADQRACTILVVEDSAFFLGHLKAFLEEVGYQVLTAENGREGLERLERQFDEIDVVMTDIEMPLMDGFEFTRAIRADERLRALPVIAVTSLAGDVDKARGFEAGVNEYLIKLDKEEILNCLNRYAGEHPVATTS